MRKWNFLVAAGACLAVLPLVASAAIAEPSGNPPTRILAGSGSDTTQDVMNAMSNVPPSGSRILGSYDATGSPTIQTKIPIAGSDCVINPRPVGSTNGVRALRDQRAAAAAPNPVRRPCLDWARSSTNTSQNAEFAGTGLTYVPFASDSLSFATRRDSLIPVNLSVAQLQAIYRCTAAGTISNPPTILPLLPQSGSGTRNDFLRLLGLPGPPLVPGTCVSDRDPTNPAIGLIENTGDRLIDARHIAPYGAAQYFSQYFRVITPVQGTTEIRRIGGIAPTSAAFPFQRDVYNVIPTRNINDPLYSGQFGPNGTICSNTNVITQFFFVPIGARCGDTAIQTPGGLGPNPGPPAN